LLLASQEWASSEAAKKIDKRAKKTGAAALYSDSSDEEGGGEAEAGDEEEFSDAEAAEDAAEDSLDPLKSADKYTVKDLTKMIKSDAFFEDELGKLALLHVR
jgi:hypothetical protein